MKKYQSINTKLRIVVIAITLFSMLLVGLVALRFFMRIKESSEKTVISEMENKVTMLVEEKVEGAETSLNYYTNYLDSAASLIEMIYKDPDNYNKRNIPKRDANAPSEYLLQRSYSTKNIDKFAVNDEMEYLSNVDSTLAPMMKKDGNIITTSYVGTESGFMISYDKYASLAEYSDDGEVYFNHRERNWYQKAKDANDIVLTDLSQDFFGRGLSLTLAKPFYNDNKFSGVVGMDLLVDDLQKTIIDIDIEEKYDSDYAFLINENGDIIASPFVDKDTIDFENITMPGSKFYSISDKILNEKKGITKANDFYCVYAPIAKSNWVLCVYVPENIIFEPVVKIEKSIRFAINIFIFLIIIVSIATMILIRIVSKRITEPILSLRDDVNKISKGDLDYKARIIGNDEVSDLATSFNNMTASLKNYISDLTNLTAEKERIGAELNVATHIQAAMLPSLFPAFPRDERFDIYATMNPAKEVGGDFYDFFKLDDKHLAMVVADVSGKGVPAALFMVIGKTLIKDHTALKRNLNETFYDVNNILCESNSEELFITAFEAVINVETGHVTYVNAGHEMPFIYKNGIWKPEKIKPSFVLAGMENMKFSGGELFLEKGNILFEYTDGVTEATNSNNELYGMDRLEKALTMNTELPMEKLLPAIKDDIDKFVGEAPQFDDITMLGFKLL